MGLRHVPLRKVDQFIFEGPEIGSGGNSAFQALNVALKAGAGVRKPCVLVGFDMRLDFGLHWHGKHAKGLNNPTERNMIRWRNLFNSEYARLRERGLKVYRESARSLLVAYPVLSIRDALAECRLSV